MIVHNGLMPVSAGYCLFLPSIRYFGQPAFEDPILKQNSATRMRCDWQAAVCVLALGCVFVAQHAGAQSGTSSAVSPLKKVPSDRSASSASHTASGTPAKSSPAVAAHAKPKPPGLRTTGVSAKTTGKKRNGKRTTVARGQQKIDPDRAQAIQEALIREHYLSGDAAATWNQASEAAMRRYQSDHGWQAKTVPDSRALISLGLGPSHDHLLNPESAMTTGPDSMRAASLTPASHSADPGQSPIPNAPPAVSAPSASAPSANSDRDSSSPQ